jgi:hypothetical protein
VTAPVAGFPVAAGAPGLRFVDEWLVMLREGGVVAWRGDTTARLPIAAPAGLGASAAGEALIVAATGAWRWRPGGVAEGYDELLPVRPDERVWVLDDGDGGFWLAGDEGAWRYRPGTPPRIETRARFPIDERRLLDGVVALSGGELGFLAHGRLRVVDDGGAPRRTVGGGIATLGLTAAPEVWAALDDGSVARLGTDERRRVAEDGQRVIAVDGRGARVAALRVEHVPGRTPIWSLVVVDADRVVLRAGLPWTLRPDQTVGLRVALSASGARVAVGTVSRAASWDVASGRLSVHDAG